MRKVVLLLLLLVSITLVYAVDFPQWQDKYVNDFAGVLSSQQSSELKSLFAGVDSDTTAEVVFVSIADCGGDYDGYAIGLAKEWKIGKEDKDNGLLILYCPNDKAVVKYDEVLDIFKCTECEWTGLYYETIKPYEQ